MKKVAIVGCADSWSFTPFNDLSVEIWTFNHLMFERIPRFNRYFDIHIPHKNYFNNFPQYAEFLKKNQNKLYIMGKHPDFPNANIINWKAIFKKYRHDYFTSTMAWLVAIAIYEKYNEISLYGVDLLLTSEYAEQKPCIEYWLGYAEGQGIKVNIQESSNLMRPKQLYGID